MHRLLFGGLGLTLAAAASCSSPAIHAGPPSAPPAATSAPQPSAPASVPSEEPSQGDNGISIDPGAALAFTDGAARMVVDSIDRAHQTAVFALLCGRRVSTNAVIPAGFYRVDLSNAVFEETSNTADPGSGHVSDVSFADWATLTQTRKDWNVTVRPQGTLVSDGPTYDLCANANGG